MLKAYLFRNPALFWSGLALRVALIALAVPILANDWFAHFIVEWLNAPTFDPWTAHLRQGGTSAAFPYGPVMFVMLLPGTALGVAAETVFGLPNGAVAGYMLGVLIAEFVCLMCLHRLQSGDTVLACLWLSPAVIVLSYWHGQNDLVPIAFMLGSLVALRQNRAGWSGALLGLAIATKLSMVLAAPVLVLYFYRNSRLRELLPAFLLGLAGPVAVQLAVFAGSEGARAMVLGTPEARKIFLLALDLGQNVQIYILPVIYFLLLFWIWRLRRITFELCANILGITFLLVALLTPATPNWFTWAAPFLALHAAQTGSRGVFLVFALSSLKALSTLLQFRGATVPMLGIDASAPLIDRLGLNPVAVSLLFSVNVALGIFIASRIWREGIRRNEFYRISKRPLLIGIAGDSGSGKDTLARAVAGIFGERAVASISGDDYHRWERERPMWTAMTHLNPRANDLAQMTGDVLKLISGSPISARRYDHKSGTFAKPRVIKFNDVVIVSGLHAFLVPALRRRYDLRIFLDMDEDLRRFFKLRRDTVERGYSTSRAMSVIERRMPDSERFVRPQREHSDVILALLPLNPEQIGEGVDDFDPRLKLKAVIRENTTYELLVRTLIGICGLQIDVNFGDESDTVELLVEGEIHVEDVAHAAGILVPNIDELIALNPIWYGGMTGLMQLIVISQAAYAIRTSDGLP